MIALSDGSVALLSVRPLKGSGAPKGADVMPRRRQPARFKGFCFGRTVGEDAGSVGNLWEPSGQANAIQATVTHRTWRGGGVNNPYASCVKWQPRAVNPPR